MKKIKKLWQIKFFKNYILFLIPLCLLEIIFRLTESLSIISYQGLRIFVGLNFISLLLSFILSLIPSLITKILNCLIVLLLSIYGIAELGFNNFLGVYASLQVKSQASAVASYITDFLKSFHWYFYLMLIPFIFLNFYYIFINKRVSLDMPKRKICLRNILVDLGKILLIIITGLLYFATLKLDFMQNKIQAIPTYELFKKPSVSSLVVNDFGFIGFGILDIKEYLHPGREGTIKIEYDPEAINLNNKNNIEFIDQVTIDNETWMNVIEAEANNTINNINKYLITKEPTKTNSYTGMFEGKNLIVIMLESGSNVILQEEYFPNFNKLYNNSWHWNNYYSPRNSCSTGNNEMSGMTGLYSIYNNCTANIYSKNTYFESIFNLFNNEGYVTNSLHNHVDYYYDRTTIHANMGSSKFYKVQDMDIPYSTKYGSWASDEDLMNFYLSLLDERDKKKPFMSWITTVTSHQPYYNSSTYNDLYYKDFPTDIANDTRRYMSKLKVVDNALGILIEGLEERGILDDTVIVLYADHYPYGITVNDLKTVLNYNLEEDNNVDQVPFFIYNSKTEPVEFNDFTTYVNITPTLANLFNIKYDSRLYIGKDMLSSEFESLAVFADGSWKNEVAFYDAKKNSVKYYTEKTYSNEEILAKNEEISLKLKMSSAIITNNYFNYLDTALNSITTSE